MSWEVHGSSLSSFLFFLPPFPLLFNDDDGDHSRCRRTFSFVKGVAARKYNDWNVEAGNISSLVMANCAGTTRSRAHDTLCKMVFCLLFFVVAVMAYIPAMPTNQTDAINGAINQSDTSMLSLQWFPNA